MEKNELKHIRLVFLAHFVVLFILVWNFKWFGAEQFNWQETIGGDGEGYYNYLVDCGEYYFNDAPQNPTEGLIFRENNKFFAGVSLLLLPFFLLATLYCNLAHLPLDFSSLPFIVSISFGALFWHFTGLHFAFHFMRKMKVPSWPAAIALLLLCYGTNLLNYTVYEPLMSHTYSFGLIAAFLYFSKRYAESLHKIDLWLMAATLGTIVIVRPINGAILVVLPLIAGSFSQFIATVQSTLKRWASLLVAIGIGIAFISVQLLVYKLQHDSWLVWSYEGEGFNFLHPNFVDFLVSYKKGAFVYTPLWLVVFMAPLFRLKTHPFQSLYTLFSLLTITYLLSTWWCWHYSGSFAQRPLIDYMAVAAFPLSGLIAQLQTNLKKAAFISVCFCLLSLNLMQTWQYTQQIISWSGMDKATYWLVFMNPNPVFRFIDREDRPTLTPKDEKFSTEKLAHSEFEVNAQNPYSQAIEMDCIELDTTNFYYKAEVVLEAMLTEKATTASIVCDIQYENTALNQWQSEKVIASIRKVNVWQKGNYIFQLPKLHGGCKRIMVYVFNENKQPLKVKAFTVSLYQNK